MANYVSQLISNVKKNEIENFFPGYFSLVMATGIVAVACYIWGFTTLSEILLDVNVVLYILLLIYFFSHVFFYSDNFKKSITNHGKSPGFLTLVAATGVLGSGFVVIENNLDIAAVLYVLGFIFWLILIYSVFIILTIQPQKPTLDKGINGIWLLMVVSTQSISILGMQLSGYFSSASEIVIFTSLVLYLLGSLLYIILITLIFYRLTFFELNAEEFAPPYWINMGGVSIVTLAGSMLVLKSNQLELLVTVSPYLKAFTLMFWSIGTWWIPIIFFLGIWRHINKKIPLIYHHQYWGMVFPLGMYSVCTYRLSEVLEVNFLQNISEVFVFIALTAWTVAFFAFLKHTGKNFKTE